MAKKSTGNGKSRDRFGSSPIKQAIDRSGGVLLLAPNWVPRAFLMPGRRLKLHPADLYAYGADRGGIDERWFASTTPAANAGAAWDEGLSYVVQDGKKSFTLKDAVVAGGADLIGQDIWNNYERWP